MKLTIIGGGPGGYTAAFAAAKAGVEVTLVERAHLGGTCLHTGCIPTKTLRSSADALDTVARLREFGIAGDCAATPDMSAIVARKRKVTATLQTGLEKTAAQLKVRVVRGDAEFVGAGLVRVASVGGSLEIAGDRVILATGSSPLELPSLPVDHRLVLSSADALELQTVPEHLVVVGGGVIGCELAFIYRAFGAKVTVIEGQGRLLPLPSVDGEISRLLLREMKKKGIAVELARTVTATTPTGTGVSVEIGASPFVEVANPPAPRTLEADAVCVTVGRVPHTDGLGLDAAGVKVDARGWIEADDFLETSVPGVYAIGDCVKGYAQLAHTASAMGEVAAENICGMEAHYDESTNPTCVYIEPEAASVGLTEEQAKAQGIDYMVGKFPMSANGKALILNGGEGLVKIIAGREYGEVLGMHIIGPRATDLICEGALAIGSELTLDELAATIHSHPTVTETIREAALSAEKRAIHIKN